MKIFIQKIVAVLSIAAKRRWTFCLTASFVFLFAVMLRNVFFLTTYHKSVGQVLLSSNNIFCNLNEVFHGCGRDRLTEWQSSFCLAFGIIFISSFALLCRMLPHQDSNYFQRWYKHIDECYFLTLLQIREEDTEMICFNFFLPTCF